MAETVEQSVKRQFAKTFVPDDAPLFKTMAESNLEEAAYIKKKNMRGPKRLQLLARNSRKRLLIGIGIELLLKAIYLRNGYLINKPADSKVLRFPFKAADVNGVQLQSDQTYQLGMLIDHLLKVQVISEPAIVLRGLKIAKVFRNKEGHTVTLSHAFEPENYRDIERALEILYKDAFNEFLTIQFSVGKESAAWRLRS